MKKPLPPGQVPPGYRQVLDWKITRRPAVALAMNLLAIPLGILTMLGFSGWIRSRELAPGIGTISVDMRWLYFLAGLVMVFVLHELIHGLAMRVFGAKPRYGVIWKGLMFYATAPGHAFPRNQYLVIALAPLVSLTLIAGIGILFLPDKAVIWSLAVYASINTAGAVGDLWMSGIVLRFSPAAYIIDEKDGMRIFLPDTFHSNP